MEKVLLFWKLLKKFTEPNFLKKLFGWLAIAFGIIVLAYGLYIFIDNWSNAGGGTEAIIALVINQLLLLLIIYLLVHVWWIKGKEILSLKENDFVVIPVSAIYFRGAGESLAIINILATFGMMLSVWFTNYVSSMGVPGLLMLFQIETRSAFLFGLIVFLNGIIGGLLLLGLFYLFAEFHTGWVEFVRNTRRIK